MQSVFFYPYHRNFGGVRRSLLRFTRLQGSIVVRQTGLRLFGIREIGSEEPDDRIGHVRIGFKDRARHEG